MNKVIDSPDFEIYRDNPTESDSPFITNTSHLFSSSSEQYDNIDIKKLLFKNPLSTFIFRAKGNNMQEAYINAGDLVIVDTSIEPQNGDIAVCVIDNEYTIKRIAKSENKLYLMHYHKNLKPIEITVDNRFSIWGILTYSIHKHSRKI